MCGLQTLLFSLHHDSPALLLHFHLSHPETGSRACLPTPPPVSCGQPSSGRRSESCGCKRMQPFTCGTTAANCWQPESISACFLPSRAWWRCSRRQSTLGKLLVENVLPRLCWECEVSPWQWISDSFFDCWYIFDIHSIGFEALMLQWYDVKRWVWTMVKVWKYLAFSADSSSYVYFS